MEKKRLAPRPIKRELERAQIKEYLANNRYGPGDHNITAAEFVSHLFKKPKS